MVQKENRGKKVGISDATQVWRKKQELKIYILFLLIKISLEVEVNKALLILVRKWRRKMFAVILDVAQFWRKKNRSRDSLLVMGVNQMGSV